MPPQPEFLTIGHVARDVQADGSFSPGGTVAFAALTAHRLGMMSAIVTCADSEYIPALTSSLPPEIALRICPSAETTTFANQYQNGFRTQHLYARAADIHADDVPPDWRDAGVVLLGPLTQELDEDMVRLFPRRAGHVLAATPQGWLRRWDAAKRVWPTRWRDAERILPLLDVLILSHDDLLPFADGNRADADAILAYWSTLVPLLVATDGRHGATLFRSGQVQYFSAYQAQEVDPTGAGDVFAAAFLVSFYRDRDPERAVDFANCTAAFSIERTGIQGIPTLAQVQQRQFIR
ncbi:MAG TPA: PfkB family carbohydrate kinase [Dictyobacter sp.]|jgi:sugar/nucleoside kinase (ribokinase family)|nr:PfkB family carbohydrate kinase [Dictyobacter sp.]